MANYRNKPALENIGKLVTSIREERELEIEDVAEMTGYSYATIKSVEDGKETRVTVVIEIALALGVHPKELFDFELEIKSRFELSPKRKEKSRITARIKKIVGTSFFNIPKSTKDVCTELKTKYSISIATKAASVILDRLVRDGKLSVKKDGRRNMYQAVVKK